MYRRIVAARVRKVFAALNAGDHRAVVAQLSDRRFRQYRFPGDHALGGVRTSADGVAEWFERLYRVFPDLRFHVEDVVAAGWPWRTRAISYVTVSASVPGEPDYTNEFMQVVDLTWGRIVEILTLEDTQRCARALTRIAGAGNAEAAAAPIAG